MYNPLEEMQPLVIVTASGLSGSLLLLATAHQDAVQIDSTAAQRPLIFLAGPASTEPDGVDPPVQEIAFH